MIATATYNDACGVEPFTFGSVLIAIGRLAAERTPVSAWLENVLGSPVLRDDRPETPWCALRVRRGPVEPTPAEVAEIHTTGLPLLVVSWPSGAARLYRPRAAVEPYEGRQYHLHRAACYRLAQDYYRELGLALPDPFRGIGVYRQDTESDSLRLLSGYADAGFEPVAVARRHDALLIALGPHPDHVAIHLGDDRILHHFRDRLSCIEPYSQSWKTRTALILRHPGAAA